MGHVTDKGEVKWAAIYDHYEIGGSIQLHLAIGDPKYVSRQAFYGVFEYPFYELDVKKVIAIVQSENHKSLSFTARSGFMVDAVIKDAYEMGDMYIFSMTPEQCPWLRGKDNGWISISTEAA